MTQRRRPYPRRRQPRKTVFTAEMWARWLAEQPWANANQDEDVVRRRTAIEEFRSRVVVSSGNGVSS